MYRFVGFWAGVVLMPLAGDAFGAMYSMTAPATQVLPGETIGLGVQVETEPGDNLVGVGHFSFAIDLDFSGTAGSLAQYVANVTINTIAWDDALSNHIGTPEGSSLVGTAGVTTDVFAPNFGSQVGDVIELFTFDLSIPPTAQNGETVVIMPREGFLQNLTVNDFFDPVAPQNFGGVTLVFVPEPAAVLLLAAGAIWLLRRR